MYRRDEDWTDFEQSLIAVLERIADALESTSVNIGLDRKSDPAGWLLLGSVAEVK